MTEERRPLTLPKFKSRLSSLGRVFLYNQPMELLLASLALVAVITAVFAFDEHRNWMDDYNEAGRADREYQIEKQRKLNE